MTTQASCRRDPRFTLRHGAFLELSDPDTGRACRAVLTKLSVSGLCFRLGEEWQLQPIPGQVFRARLLIGDCEIGCKIAIKNVTPVDAGHVDVGVTLLVTSSAQDTLMAVISGMQVVASAD